MLKKSHRLSLTPWPDLRNFKVFHSKFCSVYYRNSADSLRLAVAFRKKLGLKATQRNYLKRIVHEGVVATLSTTHKVDIVVMLNKPVLYKDLVEMLKNFKDSVIE